MSFIRYETNPYTANMLIPTADRTLRLSNKFGAGDNILLDQSTGEILGTHLTTYKQVDSAQFVKLFTQNIGLIFGLKSAGNKTFSVLMWAVQKRAIALDEVDLESLTLARFSKEHPTLVISLATYKRGLIELEQAQIIAKTMKMGRYFINPNFIFNGDRIAFTTVLERDRTLESK